MINYKYIALGFHSLRSVLDKGETNPPEEVVGEK